MALTRRQFMLSTLEIATAVGVIGTVPTMAAASPDPEVISTVYDPRFPKARQAAQLIAGTQPLQPVGSDVTDLATMWLARGAQPFSLAGVTTESVPFCLEHFARSSGPVYLHLQRLDRDLFIWTMTIGRHT